MAILLFISGTEQVNAQNIASSDEIYRPKIHFSPETHWMNDPNGMVYFHGVYHLFFQHHPYSSVWGPMHWGHATSRDMIHWKREPIALFPDSLGMIFSGSAVADVRNTSGFGRNGKTAIVAIFTQHNSEQEKAGRNDFQNQSIAYSLDDGVTWIKYAHNPVLKNPGIADFRDPKVMWYEPGKKWIMTLATKDRISFYSSKNLKQWQKESEFGETLGAHGGVWECPDLFSMDDNGKVAWVLIVNLNPGGPNKGSATQYFVGSFDGHSFTPSSTDTKWLDYGPDEYAGVTWANTGSRKIFLGWMSNWLYANLVPTDTWRNAMTVPRELKLRHLGNTILLASEPVKELSSIQSKATVARNLWLSKSREVNQLFQKFTMPCTLKLATKQINNFAITLSNDAGEKLVLGFDKKQDQYFIDRTHSGKDDFERDFPGVHSAPRLTSQKAASIFLVIDVSSVELFADDGLTVMTEIFFPTTPYNHVQINSSSSMVLDYLSYSTLNSIW